jgi:hypothetical protein
VRRVFRSAVPGSWVCRVGHVRGGAGTRLDDDIAVVALDGLVDLGDLVARSDREAARMASDGLVLVPAEPDELVASNLAALAPNRDVASAVRAHRLVDLPKGRLVQGDASLGPFVRCVRCDVEGFTQSACTSLPCPFSRPPARRLLISGVSVPFSRTPFDLRISAGPWA